jgi:hypothetical protein
MRLLAFLSPIAGILAIVAIVLSVVALADDDGDDDSDGGASGDVAARLEHFEEGLTSVQLLAALNVIDGANVHTYDEETTQAASVDDVPGEYLADVRKVRLAVQSVEWPEEQRDEADELVTQADALEQALEGDDLAAMKEASPEFHAAWHELREVGYAALGAEGAGTSTGGTHDDEHTDDEHTDDTMDQTADDTMHSGE